MYLYLRPGLFEFLEKVSAHFEIVLFNNGSRTFTDAVVDQIRKLNPQMTDETSQDLFSYVLCKDHCSINDNGQEIKNLEHFCGSEARRDIKNCLIVDNNIYSFQKQLTNGILIPKYEG